MGLVQICNIGAWVLCGIMAFLIGKDFISTERKMMKGSGKAGEEER